MAEKLLKVKGVFDPGDVQTGLQALTANMREMGKASLEVGGSKDAWAALGQSIEKMRPDLANVATVAYETAKAMDGIGRSGANFTQIESGVSKATGYLKILKDAMQEAEKAGVDIGPKVKASIEAMETGIAGAAAKAKVLRESFQGAVPPETAKNVDALSRALDNLEKAADSPRELAKAATVAQIELEDLKEAAKEAGTITAEMAKRFDEAGAQIKSASERAARFRDVAGDLATQGNLNAKSFEAAASSAGSFDGMLGHLKDTGSATQQKIADVGFAGIGLTAAFMGGYEAGKKLDEMLIGMGIRTDKFREGVASATVALLTHAGALKDAVPKYEAFTAGQAKAGEAALTAAEKVAKAKGIIEAASGKEWVFGEKAVEDVVAMGDAFETLLKKREKLGQFENEVRGNYKAILAWRDSVIDLGGSLDTLPEYQRKIIAEAEKIAREIKQVAEDFEYTQKVAETFGKNTTHEVLSVGESTKVMSGTVVKEIGEAQKSFINMAGAIDGVGENAVTGGKDLDGYGLHIENIGKDADETRRRLEALDIQMGKTGKDRAASQMGGSLSENIDAINLEQEAIGRLMEKRAQAHELLMRQMDERARRDREAHEEHMQRLEDAQAEVDAAQKLQLAEEGTIKVKGQVRILMMELTEATEAQTAALYKQVEAFKEVENQQSKVIDLAAQILSDYQSGQVSIITTLERVAENLRQLYDILGKNMNTPFEAEIRKWIKAFEDLQATLRMGGVQKTEGMRLF